MWALHYEVNFRNWYVLKSSGLDIRGQHMSVFSLNDRWRHYEYVLRSIHLQHHLDKLNGADRKCRRYTFLCHGSWTVLVY